MRTRLTTYLGITGEETLETTLNVKLTVVPVTGDANYKVETYISLTRALRDNAGTDLIIGCGGNVKTKGMTEVIEFKAIPTTMVAANRQVAIVHENVLARDIYNNYFVATPAQ